MTMKEQFPALFERLTTKYPDISEEEIEDVIEFSWYMLRVLSNDPEIDPTSQDSAAWIKRWCMEQLDKIQQGIFTGVKSYSENGFSFTLDSGDISLALQSLITAKAKVPS